MNLAIIGSRNCPIFDLGAYLNGSIDAIVSGGAKGAEAHAKYFAQRHGIKVIEFLPDYAKYGKSAPLIRNKQIIDNCDEVLAFWDGKSRGTKHALEYAKQLGKPIRIIKTEDIPQTPKD